MNRSLRAAVGFVSALAACQALAQVTFYENEDLRGRAFTADHSINDFERYGFNDRASSVIVQRGNWLVCDDANFQGNCVVLRPGQYDSLGSMGMNNRVSSVRQVKGGNKQYSYAPPPPPAPRYAYAPQYGERLYQANVIAVRTVVATSPEQRCWTEQQQVSNGGSANIPGAVIGGILGGVLGHQVGNGRGNDVATAVGAVGGAAIGANVNRGGGTSTQEVQRCTTVSGSAQPQYWDVTYDFRGTQHRAQLASAPGPTITVNERGEPRV